MRPSAVSALSAVLLATGADAGAQQSLPVRKDGSWYQRTATRDLTGDGQPDRLVLTARGHRADSLAVALILLVDGREVWREEWESDYELVDVDPVERSPARINQYVRRRLDRAFNSVRREPIDTASARHMADDPQLVAKLQPRPRRQVSITYGYESSVVLLWDGHAQRFVHYWSCC